MDSKTAGLTERPMSIADKLGTLRIGGTRLEVGAVHQGNRDSPAAERFTPSSTHSDSYTYSLPTAHDSEYV